MSLTPLEQTVVDAVRLDRIVELTRDLVRFDSSDGRESAVQRYVAEWLSAAGADVEVWPIDEDSLADHPGYSVELERSEALGVVGSWGSDSGPSLILNGHVDVVPAGPRELWTSDPFEAVERDGTLVGRGALDMKGGLACAMVALEAIHGVGAALAGRATVASVVGEEDGGLGTLALIERGHRADGAIVMEPTRLEVVLAQAGCENFRVRIPGRAAHGALRGEGVSAIEFVGPVLDGLRTLEERRSADPGEGFARYEPAFPISVGRVEGGVWASSVAEEVVLEGRFGLRVGEDPGAARRELEAAVAAVCEDDPWLCDHRAVVEWWGGRFVSARTDADEAVVKTVLAAHEASTGRSTVTGAVPYGADMGLLVHYGGIPTVLYGPGDVRNAHRPDESVPLDDLLVCARTLAVAVLRFCGVAA